MTYPGSGYDRSRGQGDPYIPYRDGEGEQRRGKSGLLWIVVIMLLVAGIFFFFLMNR
jgi:hypothetical protein